MYITMNFLYSYCKEKGKSNKRDRYFCL